MAKTQTMCPRCRQPVLVEMRQLFDLNTDSQAKQILLSGSYNIVQCPSCKYQGTSPSQLVYHDPDKELLLTFFPPDLGLPVNEQERLIGPLINQVVNALPLEKRKAYIFRPQNMLTFQSMMEKILEGDGITKEMLDSQQKRISFIQRLLSTSPESIADVLKNEEILVDSEFFSLLSRIIEASLGQGDQRSARALAGVQKAALEGTEFGQKLKQRATDTEIAVKALQDAGEKGLTREKLLELIVAAPNITQMETLATMARSGLDYTFFQQLTEKAEASDETEKKRLEALRDHLVELTKEIDQAVQEDIAQARDLLDKLLAETDIEKATEDALGSMTETFIDFLKQELQSARQLNDMARFEKLQIIAGVIQKASPPPPEIQFIEMLVSLEKPEDRRKAMEANAAFITPEFISMLNSLLTHSEKEQNQPPAALEAIKTVYRETLR
ncbi:MAG: CpXC domain-containing protein, partial [Leptolinea sp.]